MAKDNNYNAIKYPRIIQHINYKKKLHHVISSIDKQNDTLVSYSNKNITRHKK